MHIYSATDALQTALLAAMREVGRGGGEVRVSECVQRVSLLPWQKMFKDEVYVRIFMRSGLHVLERALKRR